jgi:hypothetical protein
MTMPALCRALIVAGSVLVALAAMATPLAVRADTTPFNCEKVDEQVLLPPQAFALRRLCQRLESNTLRSAARRLGTPRPSESIVELPNYGTELSTNTGLACMGGQAMRRLPNGWEQLRDETGNWQRCEPMDQ